MPTLLIAIFDDSYSVTGSTGNDPLSNRYAEARRALTVVARRGSRRELAALLHFDTPRGDVGPVSLTRNGMRRLSRSLCVPQGAAGSSELGPSLRRAAAFAESCPQHAATLVIFSDLLLLDRDPSRVFRGLEDFAGEVHLVVLGSCVTPAELDGQVSITHIDRSDSPGAVARALFASLVTHRPGSHVAT
ncbi:hypothetical protein [Kibdelosporangium aridum]|uniref:hypothetical protein n=1 Tax=Kibdelosporangium aridum TaxID=2030 RepID=UPI00117ACD26|nr:hypothetical protein [Kibdelosporangium aridum]